MFGGACVNRISDSMFHSRSTACKKPYGAVPAGQAVEFSVYPQRAQGALHVTFWIEEDGCQAESYPLHWCGYQGSHDRYTVTYTPPHPGLYWYYFSVELADGLHYCARGYGGQAELLETVSTTRRAGSARASPTTFFRTASAATRRPSSRRAKA